MFVAGKSVTAPWRAVPLVVGALALALLCWWFGLGDFAAALGQTSPTYLLVYLGFAALALLGYSLRWRLVTSALGARVPLGSLVVARVAGDAVGSMFPPGKLAGEPVRIALLRAGGLSGAEATAGVALDRVLESLGNMLCVVAYTSVFLVTRALGSSGRAALILIGVMLGMLAALAVPLVMLRGGRRPLAPLYGESARRVMPWLAGWMPALRRTEDHLLSVFRDHPAVFAWGLLGSLLIELLIIGEYHYLLAAFGVDLDLVTLLMVLLGSGFARVAPTPAGLGALEASQVGVLAMAAGSPQTGFVVGVVLRLHESLWMAAGVLALSIQGMSFMQPPAATAPERGPL